MSVAGFVDELDLEELGFNGATPAVTGLPSYHPGVMRKLYVYGYLNRVPSSRRLERECQRNADCATGHQRGAARAILAERRIADPSLDAPTLRDECHRPRRVACRRSDARTHASVDAERSLFRCSNHRLGAKAACALASSVRLSLLATEFTKPMRPTPSHCLSVPQKPFRKLKVVTFEKPSKSTVRWRWAPPGSPSRATG
jgi:hypothetical protein